jgi:hypothetical protein
VALFQDWSLEVQISNGFTNTLCYFTNATRTVTRPWPMIAIGLDQTNGTLLQQFHLDLAAAPFREIWFSTLRPFHAGTWQSPTNYVSAGDLLSSSGRILRRNAELTRDLGIMPIVPDVGLKDVDILPGGEVAFSMDQDMFSESLGPLTSGDLLTDRGRIMATNARLVSAFVAQPPVQNMGLNAVQVLDSGEIYFSVQTNFFSEALGQEIRHGDLLSSRGVIVRKNESLLARFGLADPKADYGLQAVYVWPSGEVWFSPDTGFTDTNSIQYLAGDLLSDQGYVVYRNLALLSSFAPLEDLNNFGLDALFVVTDVTPSPTPPLCLEISVPPGTRDLSLRFESQGRAFQLLKTASLLGPWLPAPRLLSVAHLVTKRLARARQRGGAEGVTTHQPRAKPGARPTRQAYHRRLTARRVAHPLLFEVLASYGVFATHRRAETKAETLKPEMLKAEGRKAGTTGPRGKS